MASGKKGKKNKGKTIALTEFLQEKSGTIASLPIRKSTTNWADEVEEYDGYESRLRTNVVLPTAPKASRDLDDVEMKVPKEPPFSAYLSNLPYDVDEDEIAMLFKGLKISCMKIPKDERPGEPPKLKGFGYVDFEDRESLMSALIIPDTTLKSRRIRIEVATNVENDRRRGRMDMSRGGDRPERTDTFGDWRSGPRTESSEMDRRGGGGGGGGGGFTRGGGDRDGFTRGDRENSGFSRDRDSGFNRDYNRDREGGGGFNRDRDRDRDSNEQSGGSWRSERVNRNTDRGSERPERGFNRNRYEDREGDRERRTYGHRRFENNEREERSDRNNGHADDSDGKSENRQRPKLNLAPRTKPVETVTVTETVPSASPSIFGNAKPVDTSLRERQIEEKLAKEQETVKETLKEKRSGGGSEDGDRKPMERSKTSKRDESPAREAEEEEDDREAEDDEDKEVPEPVEVVAPPKSEPKESKVEKPARRDEKKDKEMPKLKEHEPPNFIGNNKYAFLENEDNSD